MSKEGQARSVSSYKTPQKAANPAKQHQTVSIHRNYSQFFTAIAKYSHITAQSGIFPPDTAPLSVYWRFRRRPAGYCGARPGNRPESTPPRRPLSAAVSPAQPSRSTFSSSPSSSATSSLAASQSSVRRFILLLRDLPSSVCTVTAITHLSARSPRHHRGLPQSIPRHRRI